MSGSLYEEPPHGHLHEVSNGEDRTADGTPVLILGVDIAEGLALVLLPAGVSTSIGLDFVTWDWRRLADGSWVDGFAPPVLRVGAEPHLDDEASLDG